MTKLDEIKQALEAATPGPWRVEKEHDLWLAIKSGHGLQHTMIADCVHRRDSQLFANAPEWLAYLIGEVEWLKGANEALIQNREKWRESHMLLEQEIDRLRKALEFYADKQNYVWYDTGDDPFDFPHQKVDDDEGQCAREALKERS